ncbi:hypothetical protein HG530_005396 [Fusarium avenaceum]|nr:hypothetical protein HG530_005396 [Fusarium avenaceum]
MQQDVHVRADMDVAQLQRTSESKDKRDVFACRQLLAYDFDLGCWTGGDAARQGRIGVNVEFEEVEEGVVDHGDSAVDLAFSAVVELERAAGLVAHGEGLPFDLVLFVLNMLARFSVLLLKRRSDTTGDHLQEQQQRTASMR